MKSGWNDPVVLRGLRAATLLAPLLGASCAGLARNDQGVLQPQSVRGPCGIRKFFIERFQSVRTDMPVGNVGQACSFTLFDPNLQLVLTDALVTGPAAHGRATVALINTERQAEVTYTPQPGYIGPDRFSITLEPSAIGVTVNVTVQQSSPVP